MTQPKIKPRLPKGMRDFLPQTMLKRDYVFGIVRDVFHRFGFEPLQTPSLELRETLMGKYGADAEKLIYHAQHPFGKEELALRYDLTVPLARVVAQHQNDLTFPFKRYQLSPVWRAERPQRGRYREFYQCDADIVGVASAEADAEVISLAVMALQRLGFQQFVVKINNRKLLTAIGQYSGVPAEQLGDLYRSVDKFDKVGAEGVAAALRERGIAPQTIERMMPLLQADHQGLANLDFIEEALGHLPSAAEGVQELRQVAAHLAANGVATEFYAFDYTMVRGLGYYTGPIFEAVITEPNIGSIAGGGRYDELIGLFRKQSLPTTGISLGIERIIDLMDTFGLYPPHLGATVVQVFVSVFNDELRPASQQLAAALRAAGVATEIYMDTKGLGKQFAYADKKGVPIVAVLGPDEAAQQQVRFKRLADGLEVTAPLADAAATVQRLLAE